MDALRAMRTDKLRTSSAVSRTSTKRSKCVFVLPPLSASFLTDSRCSQIRHSSLLIKERTRVALESSSLSLLTVDLKGIINFFEGQRPDFLGIDEAQPLVGKVFSELWTDKKLNEAVTRILDEEVEETELDGVAIDRDGKKHYHRYRYVLLL
jgi:PAS domain-containing protein